MVKLLKILRMKCCKMILLRIIRRKLEQLKMELMMAKIILMKVEMMILQLFHLLLLQRMIFRNFEKVVPDITHTYHFFCFIYVDYNVYLSPVSNNINYKVAIYQ